MKHELGYTKLGTTRGSVVT